MESIFAYRRFGLLWALLAATTVAICGALCGIDPATILWRCTVTLGAVWTFQRGLIGAWRSLAPDAVDLDD